MSFLFKNREDVYKTASVIRQVGARAGARILVRTARLRFHASQGAEFDLKHSVNTQDRMLLDELAFSEDIKRFSRPYEPIYIAVFQHLMSLLPSDLSEFTFMDFGAGKGRAVLLASAYNFKKIVAVECAPELVTTMKNNLAHYSAGARKCFDVDIVCADAATVPIPAEKCVLFFFNPFKPETLQKVANNIAFSLGSSFQDKYIIYYNPTPKDQVSKLFESIPGMRRKKMPRTSPKYLILSPFDALVYST